MGASAAQRASSHLRGLLFDGVLRPGDRVDQNDVAARLDISRQPVREAVQELAADGLLVVRPQHGVFVGPFDADTVRGHYELYGVLRGYAAAKVASSASDETLTRLRALVRTIGAAATADEVDRSTAEFYRAVNIAAGNLRLRYALRAMSRFVPGNFYERYPQAIETSLRGARRILRAIEAGDPEAATAACLSLWRAGGELVVSDLVARGVLAPLPSPRRPRPSSR